MLTSRSAFEARRQLIAYYFMWHNGHSAPEALIEAYRKLDKYDEGRPLKPWLFRIAHNRWIDFLRRKGVRDEAEAAAAMPEAVSPPEPATLDIGKAVENLVAP